MKAELKKNALVTLCIQMTIQLLNINGKSYNQPSFLCKLDSTPAQLNAHGQFIFFRKITFVTSAVARFEILVTVVYHGFAFLFHDNLPLTYTKPIIIHIIDDAGAQEQVLSYHRVD